MKKTVLFLLGTLAIAGCDNKPSGTAASANAATSAKPTTSTTTASTTSSDDLVGKPAPDFTAKTTSGKEIHLAALKGKPVVLYFYPKDETSGCTKEAEAFRDSWDELAKTGVMLIGVSSDDDESHKKFAEAHKLPFELLSDADGSIAKKFGVPKIKDTMLARQTFVIGADGNVKKVYRKVDVTAHSTEILADLKS